jgi:hypothetical protein
MKKCPGCGERMQIPARKAGLRFTCPHCGRVIVTRKKEPPPPMLAAAAPASPPPTPATPPLPAAQPVPQRPTLTKEQKKVLWTLGAIAVFVVLSTFAGMSNTARLRSQIRQAVQAAVNDGIPEDDLRCARDCEDAFNKAEESFSKEKVIRALTDAALMMAAYEKRHDAAGEKRWLEIHMAIRRHYNVPRDGWKTDTFNDFNDIKKEEIRASEQFNAEQRKEAEERRQRIKEFNRQIDEDLREYHRRDHGR